VPKNAIKKIKGETKKNKGSNVMTFLGGLGLREMHVTFVILFGAAAPSRGDEEKKKKKKNATYLPTYLLLFFFF
jgi:hypothetical protein